jgi:hypothetical protein
MARADHQWMAIRKLVRAAGEGYAYDPGSLYDNLQKSNALDPLPLRLLSIAGGTISAVCFTAFLFIGGIMNDDLTFLITGLSFLMIAILLPRWRNSLAFDTFAVALQMVGLILTAMGLNQMGWKGHQIPPLFTSIGILTVMLTRSKTQAFSSVILIFASILVWIFNSGWYDGLHLYNSLTVACMTFVMLTETTALTSGGRTLWLYLPIRNAIIISCFAGYLLLTGGDRMPWSHPHWPWISYLPVIGALLVLLRHVTLELLDADRKRRRNWMIALFLLTLPSALNPAIAASLLILLLGFYTGHRTAFMIGGLGLPLFIGLWYYDLPISLLQKSIWMMVSGAACLLTYAFLVFSNKEDAEG